MKNIDLFSLNCSIYLNNFALYVGNKNEEILRWIIMEHILLKKLQIY